MKISDDTASLIVKFNFLVLGLLGVIYLIWYLNSKGLPESATQIMGIKGSSQAALKVNICPTRVKRLSFDNQNALIEEKMRWKVIKSGEAKGPIDQVGVEKWFGKNCYLQGQPTQPASSSLEPVAMFNYVDGTEALLFYEPSSEVFLFADTSFKSTQLSQALAQLAELVGLENPLNSTSVVD